jgi:hypothetical protein
MFMMSTAEKIKEMEQDNRRCEIIRLCQRRRSLGVVSMASGAESQVMRLLMAQFWRK